MSTVPGLVRPANWPPRAQVFLGVVLGLLEGFLPIVLVILGIWLPPLLRGTPVPTVVVSRTSAGEGGMPFATSGDIAELKADVMRVPHVRAAVIYYADQRTYSADTTTIYVETDLPETASGYEDPAQTQIAANIQKIMWSQPYDLGYALIYSSATSGRGFLLTNASRRSLNEEFGKPPVPSPSPTPS